MQKRTVRSFIIWLLIASPLWWTFGCTTTRFASNLNEEDPGSPIEVVTKRNLVYDLSVWKLDEKGNIIGEGKQVIRQPASQGTPLTVPFSGVIAADSVRTVLVTEGYSTASIGTVVLLAGGAIFLGINLRNLPSFGGRFW